MARDPDQIIYASPPQATDPDLPEGTGTPGYSYNGGPAQKGKYIQYIYADGRSETRFFYEGQDPNTSNGILVSQSIDQKTREKWIEDTEGGKEPARTADERERTRVALEEDRRQAAQEAQLDRERQYNASHGGLYETHAERAKREGTTPADIRANRTEDRSIAAQEAQNRQAEARLGLDREKWEQEKSEPKFLSQAGTENPYVVRFNPDSGMMEQIANPNYDRVKVQAEQLRQQLATQIQARSVTLDEAKAKYSQWFDTQVKTPLMLAQEARDKAAEQRAALDAEERRKQFAANFGLQRAELGQRAGAAAMSAEQSLLPYRAGPTEAAEMSSAINSLGAGGKMSADASAGINFTPGAFQFDAPDFKKIAKNAAKQALSGLTEYRPAEGDYQTADYSGVPEVNLGGAPQIPDGYGDFQSIIDNLKNTYSFGGSGG